MKITFRTPRDRPPVFRVGEDWFVDLTFGFGEAVEVEAEEIVEFLADAPRGGVVIARRLTRREVSRLRFRRLSSDHEAAALLLPDGPRRWARQRSRKS